MPKCCVMTDCDGVGGDRLQPLKPSKGCRDKKEADIIH